MNEYSKTLCHHGIRNQRWGVHNVYMRLGLRDE